METAPDFDPDSCWNRLILRKKFKIFAGTSHTEVQSGSFEKIFDIRHISI